MLARMVPEGGLGADAVCLSFHKSMCIIQSSCAQYHPLEMYSAHTHVHGDLYLGLGLVSSSSQSALGSYSRYAMNAKLVHRQ